MSKRTKNRNRYTIEITQDYRVPNGEVWVYQDGKYIGSFTGLDTGRILRYSDSSLVNDTGDSST